VSKATREVFEQVRSGQSMGAMQAVREGISIGVKAFAPGLTLGNILSDIGSELGRLGVQGQAEVAGLLFGNSAYVPYGRGQNPADKGIDGEERKEQSQERGGMEM
jgi:hypothetical protein